MKTLEQYYSDAIAISKKRGIPVGATLAEVCTQLILLDMMGETEPDAAPTVISKHFSKSKGAA